MKKTKKIEKKITKKKQKKLVTSISISIILLIMLVFLIGYIIGTKSNNHVPLKPNPIFNDNAFDNKEHTNKQESNDLADIFELPKEVYLLQDESGQKIISHTNNPNMKYLGKYTCEFLGCGEFQYVPSPNENQHFFGDNLVIISEWTGENYKNVLYNYRTNKIIETYDDVTCSYEFSDNKYSVLVAKDNKMGILSSSGKIVYDLVLDENTDFNNSVCHKYAIYEHDREEKYPGYNGQYGVFSKNNKFGVINLENGEVIIDFKYQAIRIMYDGNYSIKENNQWHLINKNLEKVLKKGYDEIHSFNNVILVGTNTDEGTTNYKLIDINGNDLTNNVIVDSLDINEYRKVTNNSISVGTFGGGTFVYDLSKKQLKYQYGK